MSLSAFHPACRNWFQARFGAPTEAQSQAWPAIKAGRHTLIAAPTGSGKTLAAFYAAIDDLVQRGLRHQLEEGVQIVYVSPLKALSNDIRHNLEQPLDGIAEHLHLANEAPVDIRMALRTGDTPAAERQKIARHPPHILVTTPESLYLLLSSASGRAMLGGVSTLIVDEIHALLGDKRGSHMALSMARLERLVLRRSGQHLQRIGLSATQNPIDLVARYLTGSDSAAAECEIVDAGHRRALDLRLEIPRSPLSALMSNEVWEELYQRLVELVQSHETTLVFVNTRRLAERLALALADRLGEDLVCAHHGSMSKEHRHAAEQKLKAGELRVLVATASMELGIDIGSVDLVVQFASPKSIATFLQRVGRSGHWVGGTPRGILFPLTRDDLVEATALLASIRAGELDRIVMPEKPMDILAQQLVAEVSSPDPETDAGHDLEELFQLMRRAYPYRDLQRAEFGAIVSMLAEGYSTRRGRRGAHLHLDVINGRLRGRRGANLIALTNGGAIPDMFDYQVVLDPEDIVVGSLNEDFALDAMAGDVFTLGTHAWQILRVDGLKVRVRDAQGMQPTIPFWFGEGPGRTRELSCSVSRLRQSIAELLIDEGNSAAIVWLVEVAGISHAAAEQLVEYLQAGMQALGAMPTRETLVMERFFDEVGDMHVVIHSPFGSRLNRAWGLALRKRFCKSFNFELQAAANEDSIVISLGSVHSFVLDEVYRYLQSATVRDTLIQAMLDSPIFEVRWRWNATRCLAIQRNRNGKRVPPQFQRMDAEDLVAHVFPDQIACQENITGKREVPDHPLVNQTVHDCLTEAMDIEELESLIAAIETGELELRAMDLREPSPFAQEIINARPYAFLDDAPAEERRTNAIRNRSWADPREAGDLSILDARAIARVKEEAWPFMSSAEELHDALMGLTYLTAEEFLENNCSRFAEPLRKVGRIMTIGSAGTVLHIATERAPMFKALYPSVVLPESLPSALRDEQWQPETALREIVRGRLEGLGPLTSARLAAELSLASSMVDAALTALEVEGFAFQGRFSQAGPSTHQSQPVPVEWCERRLLQRIHRYSIESQRQRIKPVSLQVFTEFLFARHQLHAIDSKSATPSLDGQTALENALKLLDGYSAPAANWEADILPARVRGYEPAWLDVMCIGGRIGWGRFSKPLRQRSPEERNGKMSPVRTSPMILAQRQNLDLWQALARARMKQEERAATILSRSAGLVETDLAQHGASFFDQICSRTGLDKHQVEAALGELVSVGRASSDSFTGLRALLTPAQKKQQQVRRGRVMFGVADAGRWSLLDTFATLTSAEATLAPELDDSQLERLVTIYLQRWGVLFRGLIEREALAPPWRVLLRVLRRMELRGIVRGGRFVSGVGGEQFAHAETVAELRAFKQQRAAENPVYFCLSACDPLNLVNLLLPNRRLPRLLNNRVLYRGGSPILIQDRGALQCLDDTMVGEQEILQHLLQERQFPPRLRSYLGMR